MKFVIYFLFIFTITAFSFKKSADSLLIETVNNSTVFIGDSIINSMQNTYTFYSKDKIQNSIIDTLKKWGFDDEVGIQLVQLSFPFLEDSTVTVNYDKLHSFEKGTTITSTKNKGNYVKQILKSEKKFGGSVKRLSPPYREKKHGFLHMSALAEKEKLLLDSINYYITSSVEVAYGDKLYSIPMLTPIQKTEQNLIMWLVQYRKIK